MESEINLANVAWELYEYYSKFGSESPITDKERAVAERAIRFIDGLAAYGDGDVEIVQEEELELGEYAHWEDEDEEQELATMEATSSTPDDYIPHTSKAPLRRIPDQKLKEALEFYRSTSKRTRSVASMHHTFSWIRDRNDLRLLRDFEQRGELGTRQRKLEHIAKRTYEIFLEKLAQRLPVHDRDVRRWALSENRNLPFPLEDFKASTFWLHHFKRKHNITNRKITKFISRAEVTEATEYAESAKKFVRKVQRQMKDFTPAQLYNSDQSGFVKELHSGRTLAIKGQKTVEVAVQSVNSTTHSYTIQATVSADGQLLSPLFLCLQEDGGQFPKTKQIFQAQNVFSVANTSAMLSKKQMKEWFADAYFPHVPKKSLLLLDSWTCYNDQDAIDEVTPARTKVKILRIPPKTTPLIQPLDRYFFRMYKNFVRRISDHILLDDIDINLFERDTVIKLQSLVHHQFSAPRFREFVKFSWYECGYFVVDKPTFVHPVEYCLNVDTDKDCDKRNMRGQQCDNPVFIKCAHCELSLCFSHFFEQYHYHYGDT